MSIRGALVLDVTTPLHIAGIIPGWTSILPPATKVVVHVKILLPVRVCRHCAGSWVSFCWFDLKSSRWDFALSRPCLAASNAFSFLASEASALAIASWMLSQAEDHVNATASGFAESLSWDFFLSFRSGVDWHWRQERVVRQFAVLQVRHFQVEGAIETADPW